MEIKTLASGSTGNAYLVGDGTTTLLLECGISMRELMRRRQSMTDKELVERLRENAEGGRTA